MGVLISVLGPLRAEVDGKRVDLGGHRRRAVLARLAVAGGHVVSTDTLIDDLWPDEPPQRALAALQVHVSHLRRVLEPGRAPRGAATVLVSSPPGYALRLDPDGLDAARFTRQLDLSLWSGPAYAEFADEPWAAPEATRLTELRLAATERLAETRLAAGQAAAAVPDLERHVRDHPLREGAVALLATALYRSGRQAEALAVLARTRRLLADELGVDPGPELRDLERAVLTQSVPTAAPAQVQEGHLPVLTVQEGHLPVLRVQEGHLPEPRQNPAPALVGRDADLARLRAVAELPGGVRLALVSGDAGAGKSALVEAFRADRVAVGWTAAVGRCPEVDGAPAGWAWRELVDQLLVGFPADADLRTRLEPLYDTGPTSADQTFWLAQAVTRLLDRVAAAGPVLVVLDDLHRAEDRTLQLLRSVVAGLAAAPVTMLVTVRPAEIGPDLEAALAALTGPIADRLTLDGLSRGAVRELLRRQGLADVDVDDVAGLVAERTGGNPLFVRELARLIATDGASAAAEAVPTGVRDVLRRRVERLPAVARTVLRQASVLGRDVEIDVLVAMAAEGEDVALDALELGVLSGLLTEPRAGWVRFAHALVRDTLYADVPRLRRTRLHAAALAALTAARPDDHAGLAHHALAAGPAVPPAEALTLAATAAAAAFGSGAHREAARLWGAAVELSGPGGAVELRIAHASALAHTGDIRAAVAARRVAVDAARGGPLLVDALTCYDVPVSWTIRQDVRVDADLVELLEAALVTNPYNLYKDYKDYKVLEDSDRAVAGQRVRLLAALVYELESRDDDRVRTASAEAMEISAALGDPLVRCVALNARGLVATGPDLHHELAGLGAELVDTARATGLTGYRAQGHHLLFQAALARHDLVGAGEHTRAAVADASGGQLGQMLGWSAIYAGLQALVAGEFDVAETTYAEVGRRLEAAGESNGALMGLIGLFAVRYAQGRLGELAELLAATIAQIPDGPSDMAALPALAAGRPDRARELWRPDEPISRNYYWLFLTALRAEVAIGLDDREMAARCYADLLPHAGTLAGLASGTVTVGPVARTLAELAELLGLPASVVEDHRETADRVAHELGAGHWADQPNTSRSRRR